MDAPVVIPQFLNKTILSELLKHAIDNQFSTDRINKIKAVLDECR